MDPQSNHESHMPDDKEANTPPPNFERHLQTILLSIVTGLLAWNYTTTQSTQVDLAGLSAQTEALRADVNKLQATMERASADRYTGAQASAQQALYDARFERMETRILELERKK